MEKQLLKQSGIIAVIVTFVALGGWFGFAKLSLGAYNEKDLTKRFLAEDSAVFKTIVIEVGSYTVARIIAGTSSMTRTGTSSYPYQPRIQYDGATGLWSFKNSGGTETTAIGTVTAEHVAEQIGSAAANYVLKNNGSSTGQLATDATLAGATTIGTGSTITAGGDPFAGTKVGYLAGVNQDIGNHFVAVENTASNHAHVGTDSVRIDHSNLTNKGTQTHPQIDTFIAKEGQANGLATTNANNLVIQNPASASAIPGTSTIVMTGTNSNKITDAFLSDNVTKLGTPTTSNIPEGSNLYHTTARVNTVIASTPLASLSDTQNAGSATDGQFLKKVGNKWQGAASAVTTYWSDILGNPASGTSASTQVSSIPLADKIPYSLNGNLDSWFSGLINTITLPATTTAQVGSTTASKIYVSSSQVSAIPDTLMHANTKLMLRMNGTNTSQVFTDSSTNNYTITRYGDTYQSPSVYKFGNASGYFDGAGDYLAVPDNADWTWGTGDATIRGWFNPDDSTSTGLLLAHGDGGDNFWYINKTAAGKLNFYIQPAGGPYTTLLGPTTHAVGSWNHFAMTKAGTTYRIFLNGSLQFETTQATTVGDYAQTLKIGIHMNATAVPYKGYLDNIEFIKGTALYTGTFTVPTADSTTGTLTRYSTKIIAPGGGTNPQVLLEMQTWDTVNGTAEENSIASGTPTVNCFPGSVTVFGAGTPLGTSTLHTIHANGGILSNLGHYTLCFDSIKVITDDSEASLRGKYQRSFYDIKVKESYARKGNIPWIAATDIAKRQYKQEKYQVWKSANIDKSKYYVDEFLPGSGTTVQSFQAGAFETDYNNYIEGEWASDLIQNDYVQDVKDEQDMDKTRRMLRASLSDPSTPAIIKAPDGSALSLDDQMALAVMVIQEQNERLIATSQQLGSVTAEIEALKVLRGK